MAIYAKQGSTAVAAVLLVLVVLLLTASTCSTVAAAPTHRHVQHQRQRAFVKYAERVGAALDLLTKGTDESLTEAELTDPWATAAAAAAGSSGAVPPPPVLTEPDNPFAFFARAVQLPHVAVQAAVAAVTQKAAAARTLASVLSGAALSEEQEVQLAAVRNPAAAVNVAEADAETHDTRAAAATESSPPSFAAQRTVDHAAEAIQREVAMLADTVDPNSQFITCNRGYVALASFTRVTCRNGYATSLGLVMSLPAALRRTCSIVPQPFWGEQQQQCICPFDALLIRVGNRAFACMTRPVDVQVLLDDSYLCNSAADAALGLPSTTESEYCIKTTRSAQLSLAVQWRYAYISLDALRAAVRASTTFVTPTDVPFNEPWLQWVVLGRTPPVGLITTANSAPYAQGSYSQLTVDTTLFPLVTPISAAADAEAAAAGRESFYVTADSSLYQAYAFDAIFSFGAPRRTLDHLHEVQLNATGAMAKYFGNLNGVSSHTLQLDLSNVSDAFVEGDQMYVETGIRGGSAAYTYRVARLHISFTDHVPPPANSHRYPKQFNPLYILLIVAIGAVVVGACLAALWYHLMQREEYDENIVADAQRKREKKALERTPAS